ncbi:MAG TPA: MBL fold metallo-hydrolase [Thermoanaerobaculia bacterium]|jgi:glyoxylase-like metal-dependent hydrolase (beta-lactamase superfamily II)|nr:MBL fold metallo-hydrolase [Thermoanaerobaculia bacterium]
MRRLYLALLLLLATTAFAQRDFSKVEVKATKVAGSVYMIVGAGGNIGVSVGDDGIVMIDDQYAPLAPKIEAALKTITDKPVRFIINTHYHGDHTGGNEHFGKSAPIVAHENVRKRLSIPTSRLGTTTPPSPAAALPVLTFNNTVTIHLNGEDVRAVHMPHGHTDGDAVIWFTKSNVVHMGDDFFNGNFPFVDRENGGSVKGLIANIDHVVSAVPDDAKIIPGHGPLSDKAGLRNFGTMLKDTLAAVQAGVAAGKTAEQLKSEKVLAAWDSWGTGFIKADRWIDTIYDELSRHGRQR